MSNSIPKTTKKLGVYQFGEQIGKGAKGVVFKGINVETAGIVAIKQISIENIGEDGEKAIQMEINLLKKLKHENIVKYIDALSTPTHLHIILEYVDAGCLHSVIDKFGPFPETLVAIYIKQVLQGLDYLHSQGVVHRDIKGANILTTKEGLVKLADFGVATKLVEGEKVNSTNSVVGTPYWMAPEIIEMRGNISTSCDIWSVGCTVIELLTGSPPYFDLNKWSALFRIVQDEHPPIPTGISEGCKEFLFQCFQKEPVLRIDAKGLLKHPWIRNQNHQALDIIANPGNQLPQEVTNTIRLHIDKSESLPFLPKDNNVFFVNIISPNSSKAIVRVQTKSASEEEEVKDYNKKESAKDDYRHGKTWTTAQRPHEITSEGTTMPHTRGDTAIHTPYETQNHENSLYRLTHSTVEGRDSVNRSQNLQDFQGHRAEYPDNSYHQGIDNMKFSQVSMGKQADNFGTLQDGSSFIYGDHPDAFNGAPPNQNIKANIKKMGYVMGATVPQQEYKFVKEISNLLSRLASNSPFTGAANLHDSTQFQDMPRDSTNLGRESARLPEFGGQYQENISEMQGSGGGVNVQETLQDLQRLEEIFNEYPVSRDHFMRRYGLTGLTDILEQTEVPEVKEEVLQVINTLTLEDPSLQEKACLFGILPYIIKYASSEHPKDLRVQAARFLGRMSEANDLPFHMFLSAGGFKALVELLDVEYEKNRDLVGFAIEMLGLIFDRKILPTPHLCRILVKLDVFQRLIIVVGSLYKDARDAADGRESQEAEDFLLKSLGLMNNFAQCEDRNLKGILGEDNNLLALTLYFRKFQCFPNVMAKTAKILCNLSSEPLIMDKFERIKLLPEVLKLISKERQRPNGPHEEALVELLKLLLQMCQLNPNRQEEVVQNGGVEVLIELKHQGTKNVERYVVSTLCQFVETSERTRKALWDNGGPKLFLDFLDEDYYQPKILDTMALWLEEDPEEIENILIESVVFNKLVQIFKSANKIIFQQIVPIYLKLIVHSEEFTSRLSKTSEFLREIVERLGMEPNQASEDKASFSSKGKLSASKSNKLGNEVYGRKTKRSECINPSALVRKELLDILVHLCIRHENPRGLMNEHNLYPIILQILHLSQNDEMVILTEIATLLLRIYSEGPTSSNRYDTASLLDTA